MKSKIIFHALIITASIFAWSCSGKKEQAQEESAATEHASGSTAPTEADAPQFAVEASFQLQLADVFKSYISLKDAFVASDPAKVKSEAATASQALTKVDMKLLSGAAHNDWMNYLSDLESSLKAIDASNDIEEQRAAFSTLSNNMYKSINAFGLGGTTAYYEFCPMAFNDQGGYWLSDTPQIRNPYFGDKMLTCGSVKDTLK